MHLVFSLNFLTIHSSVKYTRTVAVNKKLTFRSVLRSFECSNVAVLSPSSVVVLLHRNESVRSVHTHGAFVITCTQRNVDRYGHTH